MRIDRLRTLMASHEANTFLVTDLTNIRYLTGFTGSSAALLVSVDDVLIISDGRYQQQLLEQCPDIESAISPLGQTLIHFTAEQMNNRCEGAIHFEHAAIGLSQFEGLRDAYRGTLEKGGPWVEKLRAIKDPAEIQLIRESVAINQAVFRDVISTMTAKSTEREIAAEIEYQGRRRGADGCSFEPIVAVGKNAALAHYRPGNIALGDGDFALIDWGLIYRGYASDLTRMVVKSKIPPQLAEIYNVALAAQMAAIDHIKPGVETQSIDAVARDLITEAGYGDRFNHSLGHGIGLNVHEGPRLSSSLDQKLEAGMVVTVEPGIYLPGLGGVRIEDDVLVTPNGAEVISNLPKELQQCVVPV